MRRLLTPWAALGLGAALYFLLASLAGCAGPQPVPPVPGPTPGDPFAGAVIDCAAPEVEQGMVRVDAAVRGCLLGTATAACLVALYPGETVNTIACSTRQVGIDANIAVLRADAPAGETTTIDNAARAWITQERLAYRSLRP